MATIWEDLEEVLKKHNTTLADVYWTQAVEDYLSCLTDDFEPLSVAETNAIVNNLLNDDQMWGEIDYSIEWYFHHLPRYLANEDIPSRNN